MQTRDNSREQKNSNVSIKWFNGRNSYSERDEQIREVTVIPEVQHTPRQRQQKAPFEAS